MGITNLFIMGLLIRKSQDLPHTGPIFTYVLNIQDELLKTLDFTLPLPNLECKQKSVFQAPESLGIARLRCAWGEGFESLLKAVDEIQWTSLCVGLSSPGRPPEMHKFPRRTKSERFRLLFSS